MVHSVLDGRMDANIEPALEHFAGTVARPERPVRAPFEQPSLEEDVEVLANEGPSLAIGFDIGSEEDNEIVVAVV